MWDAGAGGEPRTTVYGRFLPDRRLVLELALVYSNTSAYRKVLFVKEQELRPDLEPWLVWHDVRDVAPEEYLLFRA
jgi:hypothetical protein